MTWRAIMGAAPEPETLSPQSPISSKPPSQGNCGDCGNIGDGVSIQDDTADAEADRDDDWEERAAIVEYDGKLCRDDAEAVADACCPPPPQPEPEDWRPWFESEVARRVSHMGLEAARRRAVGVAVNLWNLHHGSRGEPSRCAGCGEYLAPSEAFRLGDGAMVHGGDAFLDCLRAYGSRWRPAALVGLQRPCRVGHGETRSENTQPAC